MSDSTGNYPIVMTQAGALPQAPTDLLAQLIQLVTFGTDPNGNRVMTPSPGYTAGLPGSLIEDISSTDTAALVLCDRARVELINSLTPWGANAFILNQLGQLLGVPSGTTTNVSVGLVFSGTVNFMISRGFVVSDGIVSFVVQEGGIIGALGVSGVLTAVATQGAFTVAAGSVTQIVTSLTGTIQLSVTNPFDGTGGATTETEQAYRVRVLQASIVACQGSAAFLKTLLMNIQGVVLNQVGVQAVGNGGWKVICGGANPDPYAIANAIYQALPDISTLQSSVMAVASVADQCRSGDVGAEPRLCHRAGGDVQRCAGHDAAQHRLLHRDGGQPDHFTIGVNTTSFGAYASGGVIAPNLRNNLITITDYPDVYQIPFVTPPAQSVAVVLTWNAVSILASGPVISQLAATEMVNYMNALAVGQPINLFALEEAVVAGRGRAAGAAVDLVAHRLVGRDQQRAGVTGAGHRADLRRPQVLLHHGSQQDRCDAGLTSTTPFQQDQPSVFPPAAPTTMAGVIPSYLYQQYSDDDNLHAFVNAYNVMAQWFVDWFNGINLAYYPGLRGDMLDWVAGQLCGVRRQSLSMPTIVEIGGYNTAPYNSLAYDEASTVVTTTYCPVNDDVFCRMITWHVYKGDGYRSSTRWLKRRVHRYLNGDYGTPADDDVTFDVSVIHSGTKVTIGVLNSYVAETLQYAIADGVLALPLQYQYEVVYRQFMSPIYRDGAVINEIAQLRATAELLKVKLAGARINGVGTVSATPLGKTGYAQINGVGTLRTSISISGCAAR